MIVVSSLILADNPKIGNPFRSTAEGIYMFSKQSHNIFYRITADQIEIIRVIHHSRLAASMLG